MAAPRDDNLLRLGKRHAIDAVKGHRPRLAVPLAHLHARGALPQAPALHQQPVVVKVDTPAASARGVRATYLTHGKGRDGQDAPLYGPGSLDPAAFAARHRQDDHRFTLMVSFPEHAGVNREQFITQYMAQVGEDLGADLDWVAADHYDSPHPHTHIVLRGVVEGEDLYMKKGYYTHGLRERASAFLTQLIGRTQESERQTTQQRTWETTLTPDMQRHLTSQRTFQADLQRLRMAWDAQRLDGVVRGPADPDLLYPLSRAQQVYGHEGLAAHVDRLWEHMQRGQFREQGRGY